jgi:hypothetical protein
MKSHYNALLENFMNRASGWMQKQILEELKGNHSPTEKEFQDALDGVALRLAEVPTRRLRTPKLKFCMPNPSREDIQAALRDWSRDPRNWELLERE